MNWKKMGMALLVGVGWSVSAIALEYKQEGGLLIFRTATTEVRIKDARIIGLKNLKSGVVLASPTTPASAKTGAVFRYAKNTSWAISSASVMDLT